MKMISYRNLSLWMWKATFLLLVAFASTPAMAEELTAKDAQTFTVYFENDTFFGTDYLYTNGVRLSWTSLDLETCRDTSTLGSGAYSLIGWLPFTKSPEFHRSVSLSIGQNMYTPQDTESKQLIKDDRPLCRGI